MVKEPFAAGAHNKDNIKQTKMTSLKTKHSGVWQEAICAPSFKCVEPGLGQNKIGSVFFCGP